MRTLFFLVFLAIAIGGCSMQQSPKDCVFSAPNAQTVENVKICDVQGDPTREGNTVSTDTDANVGLNKKPGGL